MFLERSKGPIYTLSLVVLFLFVTTAAMYSVITPAWETPDEVGHFDYVVHLLTYRVLPMQRMGQLGEAHQPPLYYMIAAIAAFPAEINDSIGAFRPNPRFMWSGHGFNEVNASFHNSDETFPFRGQSLVLHLARGISVLMGMVTVALVIRMGLIIFPDRPVIALLAGVLVAFNPQFLFISGSVNNDNLLTLSATGAWWQVLHALKRPKQGRQWIYVGIWVAIAIMAKLSGFVVAVVTGIGLAVSAIHKRSIKIFVQGALALILPVILITGWWFARNQILYGDPLGWAMFKNVYSVAFRNSPLQWNDLYLFFTTQINSFWGVFGWLNVWAPSWFYTFMRISGLLGFLGVGFFVARRYNRLSSFQRMALIIMVLAVMAQEFFILWSITRLDAAWYQGRFLFPVIGPGMILMSLGLVSLLTDRLVLPLVSGLALVSIAVYMPFGVISPAYEIVPLPKWKLWLVPNKTDLTFGDHFKLKGFEVREGTNGSQVTLTLYWQSVERPDFDYSVFVHLIDESNQLVAQKDHAPGENQGYPPTVWWPGDIVADEHRINISSVLAPGSYHFRVGVYNWATREQLPVSSKVEPIGSFAILGQWQYH